MKTVPVWHSTPAAGVYLCRRFELPGDFAATELGAAWLYCASQGAFEVRLNGQPVGRGLGQWLTDLTVWIHCDIAGHLVPGENVLAVRVLCGGEDGSPDPRPWFAADGAVRIAGESTLELTTGDGWDSRPAPHRDGRSVGAGCEFHASEPVPWHSRMPGERPWERAAVVEAGEEPVFWSPPAVTECEIPGAQVVAFGEVGADCCLDDVDPQPLRAGRCLNREALLVPGKREAVLRGAPPDRAVCLLIDFGRPVSGFPRLRLQEGGVGARIEIGFGLGRNCVDSELEFVAGGGREDWTGLLPRTARFLTIRVGHTIEDLHVDCVSMMERSVDSVNTPSFSGSEPLESVWQVSARAVARRSEVYVGGWGDRRWLCAYTLALSDYYLGVGSARAAATLAGFAPPTLERDGPEELLAYVLFLDAYVWYCDDRQPAAGTDVAAAAISCLDELTGTDGLLEQPRERPGEGSTTALNALYAGALQAVIRLCQGGGDEATGQRLQRRLEVVGAGLLSAWDPERSLFTDAADSGFSQWANGLLLYFGLVDADRVAGVARALRGSEVARVVNLVQAFFLVTGLWRAGAEAQALTQVERHWGRLLERDGETWGQRWVRSGGEAPGPEFLLGAEVLGVRPAASGYETVEVAPPFAGIERAAGTVKTPRGTIDAAWGSGPGSSGRLFVGRSEAGRTRMRIPRAGRRFPTLTLNDETVWRNEKFYPNSAAREVISDGESIVLITDGAGPYRVVVD